MEQEREGTSPRGEAGALEADLEKPGAGGGAAAVLVPRSGDRAHCTEQQAGLAPSFGPGAWGAGPAAARS